MDDDNDDDDECNFTLLITVCVVGGVTCCTLSLVLLNIKNKMRLGMYKMNFQSFKSAASRNLKLVCWMENPNDLLKYVKLQVSSSILSEDK